jgi:DNA-binding transcriptional regulator GbsR (MarR family)
LRELAKQTGEFHGGAISRATGYSRKQVQSELRKLETIGLIERAGSSGRAELLRVADDELSELCSHYRSFLCDGSTRFVVRRSR